MVELQKIELLQWFYANLTIDQLKQVKLIAENIKTNESKDRHAANLPEAGKKN